jgi:carbon storage regulator
MLVLSRRVNEKIVMPTLGAAVQVVAAKNGVVRIGIEAPEAVPVFREEVLERLDPEERARLAPTAPAATDHLRAQVHLLSEALSAAAAGMAQLRRQLKLWKTEDLGAVLDRLIADVRLAQQKATGTEPAPYAIAPVQAHADYVVF